MVRVNQRQDRAGPRGMQVRKKYTSKSEFPVISFKIKLTIKRECSKVNVL